MELVIVDKNNYKEAIEVQKSIFPTEDGTLNILASIDRDLFIEKTGMYYEDDNIKYYLAKIDNKYVGITGIYNYDPDSAWLGWFGILDEYKNKGLGTLLLKETINLAAAKNFKHMRLYTDFNGNSNAIKLYEKIGFIGEKYTAEKLSYDCRIYSKSITDNNCVLWNNKNLNLIYQSELDHPNKDRISEILKIYDDMFK